MSGIIDCLQSAVHQQRISLILIVLLLELTSILVQTSILGLLVLIVLGLLVALILVVLVSVVLLLVLAVLPSVLLLSVSMRFYW